ncbi:MAG TPA: efflux RND transporter periplasmic adaptor subunit [Bacteroidales bacterium]|mgnify:FL=1|nr:efflux RND transporter periplasmic adaptor subunit [Bacteroidales bacterium]HPS49475.1 efflux RND transporter periplasmic adaptor subunit [Bacteroidales bacterium]
MESQSSPGMDRVITEKRWIKKKYWKYIAGGVIILAVILFFIFRDWTSTVRVEKERITIATVLHGVFNDYITNDGTAAPISTVYLDAYEGGKVEEIILEEGSMLKKGDIIIKLSNNDLNLNILNSEAQLAEKSNFLREVRIRMEQEKHSLEREMLNAKFDLIAKKRTWEQNKELYKDELISHDEFIRSEEAYLLADKTLELVVLRQKQDNEFRNLQIEQITENLKNMQMNLALVKQQQEYLNVKSPVDGQLGSLMVEIGQSISRGFRIGQVNILTSYKIEADVDEHYIDRIRPGLTGYIERPNDTLQLEIKKVYPEVRNGRFKIDLVFTGKLPENIRIGQSYFIKLQLGQPTEAIQIPQGSFYQATGGQWIFVLDKSGRYATKRNIKIGRKNPQYYEVMDGLAPGEQVIVSDYAMFGDNDKVELE